MTFNGNFGPIQILLPLQTLVILFFLCSVFNLILRLFRSWLIGATGHFDRGASLLDALDYAASVLIVAPEHCLGILL